MPSLNFPILVEADAAQMGGSISHEFHYFAKVGEEVIQTCSKCGHAAKAENDARSTECSKCLSGDVRERHAIEVGHTFYLGDTYTKRQNANYLHNGKPATLVMGCHGIGVTRLIAAALEASSDEADEELHWPKCIAPFSVCIIPPKKGSKEDLAIGNQVEELLNCLSKIDRLRDDVIVDDRTKLTIGKRLVETQRYKYTIDSLQT